MDCMASGVLLKLVETGVPGLTAGWFYDGIFTNGKLLELPTNPSSFQWLQLKFQGRRKTYPIWVWPCQDYHQDYQMFKIYLELQGQPLFNGWKWWVPTIFDVKIWFIIQLKQPLNHGCFRFQVGFQPKPSFAIVTWRGHGQGPPHFRKKKITNSLFEALSTTPKIGIYLELSNYALHVTANFIMSLFKFCFFLVVSPNFGFHKIYKIISPTDYWSKAK